MITTLGAAWHGNATPPRGLRFDKPEATLEATGTPLPPAKPADESDEDAATQAVAKFMRESGVDPDYDGDPEPANPKAEKREPAEPKAKPEKKDAKAPAQPKPPAKGNPKNNGKAKPAKPADEADDQQDEDEPEERDERPEPKPTKKGADYAPKAEEPDADQDDDEDDSPDLDALAKKYSKPPEPEERPEPRQERRPAPRPEPRREPPAPRKAAAQDAADEIDDDADPGPLFDDAAIEEMRVEYGEKLAARMQAANKTHQQMSKRASEAYRVMRDMTQYVKEQAQEQIASRLHTATSFFGRLAKSGWEDTYGSSRRGATLTDEQDQERAKVITKAMEIQRGEARSHAYINWEQALEAAHRQCQAEALEARAKAEGRREVESQIQRRSRKRDLFGDAATSRFGRGGQEANEDDAATAAVGQWLQKRGLAR